MGDGFIENLGVEAEDLFQLENVTKQQEEDLVLEQIKQEYGFEDIKESFDEGKVPENIYFLYGSERDNFYRAIKFMGPDADNREFVAFLMSAMARQVMTSSRLSKQGTFFMKTTILGTIFTIFWSHNKIR